MGSQAKKIQEKIKGMKDPWSFYNIGFMGVTPRYMWGYENNPKKTATMKNWMYDYIKGVIGYTKKMPFWKKIEGFRFVTGLNCGSEHMFAEMALGIAEAVNQGKGKEIGINVPERISMEVWGFLPYKDFGSVWPDWVKEKGETIKEKCDRVICNHDEYEPDEMVEMYKTMCEMADTIITAWTWDYDKENPSGIGTALNYAYTIKPKRTIMYIEPRCKHLYLKTDKDDE